MREYSEDYYYDDLNVSQWSFVAQSLLSSLFLARVFLSDLLLITFVFHVKSIQCETHSLSLEILWPSRISLGQGSLLTRCPTQLTAFLQYIATMSKLVPISPSSSSSSTHLLNQLLFNVVCVIIDFHNCTVTVPSNCFVLAVNEFVFFHAPHL